MNLDQLQIKAINNCGPKIDYPSMSDTPKTDEAEVSALWMGDSRVVRVEFARELERENAALREDKARLDWLASCRSFNMKGESIVLTPESIRASIDDKRKEAQP